ncbi:MAG TPA: hypothetical protein VFZ40_16775 [Pyrinomonadaceae bacterium]
MKKTTRILPLLFSVLLLLVSVTMSASAQDYFVEGEITWVNRFGVVPARPGDSRPAAAPCAIFSVVALDARSKRPVAYTDQGASPFQFSFPHGVNYVCKYSLKVPEDRDLYIMATMGSLLQLPKTDRDPYLITDPWIYPAAANRPWARTERGFKGATFVTLSSRDKRTIQTVNFQMTYVSNEASEKVIPAFFAGAWQANFGGSVLTMIFQQTGDRVTGRLNANSADLGVIRDGKVVDNTLRLHGSACQQGAYWRKFIRCARRHWRIGDGCKREIFQR